MCVAALVSVSIDLQLDQAVGLAEHAERVAVVERVDDGLVEVGERGDVGLDEPVRDHEVGRGGAEVGAQAAEPALELGAARA